MVGRTARFRIQYGSCLEACGTTSSISYRVPIVVLSERVSNLENAGEARTHWRENVRVRGSKEGSGSSPLEPQD